MSYGDIDKIQLPDITTADLTVAYILLPEG